MLRHRPPTAIVERVTIVERATAGETDVMIAASLGCLVWTVRKWRHRGQHQGRAGLIPRRGCDRGYDARSTLPAAATAARRRKQSGWPGRRCSGGARPQQVYAPVDRH